MEASEASLEQVQILRERDVCDLAESQRNVLNVQKVVVGMRIADRPFRKPTHKPYIDQVLTSIPPVNLLKELLDIE